MILPENLFEHFFEDWSDDIDDVQINLREDVFYEDKDFSSTPAEAFQKLKGAEEVLGFELSGNQVQYLATNWAGFYNNPTAHKNMKEFILQDLADAGLLDQEFTFSAEDDDFDRLENTSDLVDSEEGFKKLNVQSWEQDTKDDSNIATSPEDEYIYSEDDDDIPEMSQEEIDRMVSKGK